MDGDATAAAFADWSAMRASLFLVILVHLLVYSASVSVKEKAAQVEKNNETDWTFWFGFSRTEEGLEVRWKQLEEKVRKSRFGQEMVELRQYQQDMMNEFEHDRDIYKKKVKHRIATNVFHQWQGRQRFLKSARDHVGFALGGSMTFFGGDLGQTSTLVQTAQLSWGAIHMYNMTSGFHDPWLKDAAAGAIAAFIVSQTLGTSLENATQQRAIPLLTIGVAIIRSVGIIVDNLEGEVNPATRTALHVAIAGIGTAVLSIIPVPLPLVASSLAGASLMYKCVTAHVVGNWFYMLERMTPEKRRNLRQQAYHQLEKKLLYPVHHAYEDIHAALYNETLAEPSLHDKVHTAIEHSMKVKVVWSFAAAGVAFQTVLRKAIQKAALAVYMWGRGQLWKARNK